MFETEAPPPPPAVEVDAAVRLLHRAIDEFVTTDDAEEAAAQPYAERLRCASEPPGFLWWLRSQLDIGTLKYDLMEKAQVSEEVWDFLGGAIQSVYGLQLLYRLVEIAAAERTSSPEPSLVGVAMVWQFHFQDPLHGNCVTEFKSLLRPSPNVAMTEGMLLANMRMVVEGALKELTATKLSGLKDKAQSVSSLMLPHDAVVPASRGSSRIIRPGR